MGKERGEPAKGEAERETHTPANTPEESDPTKQPKRETGGLSREQYREATERAVEDIHG